MGFRQLELLRQLINVETNQMKLLQVVLFAQDELRTKLANARAEIEESDRHGLDPRAAERPGVGRDDRLPLECGVRRWTASFTPEALVGLFEHSGGMPREATILADNALLLGFYRQQSTIDRQTIDDAAADRHASLAMGEGRHGGQ